MGERRDLAGGFISRFADPERTVFAVVQDQSEKVRSYLSADDKSGSDEIDPEKLLLVLNRTRQIVYATSGFCELVAANFKDLLGLRHGEAVKCLNINRNYAGCGTTDRCYSCEAILGVLDAQDNKDAKRKCTITTDDGAQLRFKVEARLVDIDGEPYTMFAMSR